MKVDREKVNNILVIKLRHHGDVLLTSPLIAELREQWPSARIDALIYEETRPFLSPATGVDSVYGIDRAWKKQGVILQFSKELSLFRALKANHYDLVIALTDQWRIALLTRWLKPRYSISGLCSRRKNSSLWRNSFSTIAVSAKHRHRVQIHSDVLRCLGLAVHDRPAIYSVGAEASEQLKALVADEHLLSRPFIHWHLPSRQGFKMLSIEKAVEMVQAVAERFALPMVFTSAPDENERSYVAQVVARCSASTAPLFNLSGQLNIDQLAALTKQASCFIGVDSAPMHLAAAVGVPTVGIFGPSDYRMWAPYGEKTAVFCAGENCQPCNLKGCANSGFSSCLEALRPQLLIENVELVSGLRA